MATYCLLTTSIVSADNSKLQRMIDSLREYDGADDVQIRHILLLQKTSPEQGEALRTSMNMPAWTELLTEPEMMSLSKARNIMLRHLHTVNPPAPSAIVAFPDDDCWYPSGLLRYISGVVADKQSEFFFCRYATQTQQVSSALTVQVPTYGDLVFNASSNTLFINAGVVKAIGAFSEELGVGAKYNGGEDLDYAVQAYRRASNKTWVNAPLVGHRDKMEGLKGNYFTGSARVLRSNALH
ncbi:MAG: hypothetical protein VW274_05635, partial [Thalassolituus sp.]